MNVIPLNKGFSILFNVAPSVRYTGTVDQLKIAKINPLLKTKYKIIEILHIRHNINTSLQRAMHTTLLFTLRSNAVPNRTMVNIPVGNETYN